MCIFAPVNYIYSLLIYVTMAKGNLLLGYGRGKVGSLVFSRRKGEQIVRARNEHPANPRTNAQLAQRMKMYAPVKLYRQSMERFFKYAFSLKDRETIFNAFMRENISLAPWTSRELVTAQAPIPFPAHMSSGGLGGFPTKTLEVAPTESFSDAAIFAHTDGTARLAIFVHSNNEDITIGEFSEYFLDVYPQFAEGDQVTFVLVSTAGLIEEEGSVAYDESSVFNFQYAKVVLDKSSSIQLSAVGVFSYLYDDNMTYVGLRSSANYGSACVGGCVIVTRSVGGKVDATNTTLVLNPVASSIYTLMRTDSYRAKAAASYHASPDAYLNPATTSNV